MNKRLQQIIEVTQDLDVLFVEDDEETRRIIEHTLKIFFRNIYLAEDGEEGLQLFHLYSPKVIITDILMPRMGGLQMVKIIKEIDPSVKVIVMTAYDESKYFMEAIEIGVDGFILKPIDTQRLISALQKIATMIREEEKAQHYYSLLKQYKTAIEKGAITATFDGEGKILDCNWAFSKMVGFRTEDLIGKDAIIFFHDEYRERFWEALREVKRNKRSWKGILRVDDRKGSSYYISTTLTPIEDEDRLTVFSISFDITEVMKPRRLLIDFLRRKSRPVVGLIEIENKENLYNYFLEEMINKLAEKLEKFIQSRFTEGRVFNLDNLQFAVAVSMDEITLSQRELIRKFAELQRQIEQFSFPVEDIEYRLNTLVSVAGGKRAFDHARVGLNRLRQEKRKFIISTGLAEEERKKAERTLKILEILKEAIENNRVISYYQPIINNHTGKISHYEVLVRILHNGEVLSPFMFLEIARNTSYYSKITPIVLHNGLKLLKCNPDIKININLSAVDLEQDLIREELFRILGQNEKYLNRLTFELLENEEIKDRDKFIEYLGKLREMGAKLAIDDFGSGYSNFKRMLEYRPQYLKIDGSLIKDIVTDPLSKSMVKSIVSFAKDAKIETVAEFVESREIYEVVKELGIDYSQGYYFGRPGPLTCEELNQKMGRELPEATGPTK
ncbi:MAG: EAL domain-containing protein [Campylobacterales bacterium]